MRIILLALIVVSLPAGARPEPAGVAERNARQASDALWRSNQVLHAWLRRTDRVTGLLPRTGKDPNWVVQDSAADLYPFMVLAARFTEPALDEGAMRDILRREVLAANRVGRLPDDVLAGGRGFVFADMDIDRVIFGASEYAKDGLIPITELLGETPWYHRMRGLVTDILRNAPYSSARGRLPAQSAEVNGNMLQVLSRLSWKTSDQEYLRQALAIGDTYFLDILPNTGYIPPDRWNLKERQPAKSMFRLSDHGNEIVGGLAEVTWLAADRAPDRAAQYSGTFIRMIDRLLETGRNADGIWITALDMETGKPTDTRHVHCWGYMLKPVFVAYLLTGQEKYKQAVQNAISAVIRKPEYLFDEQGAGRGWGANAYSDSIESALVLLNRLPDRAFGQAIDAATRKMLDRLRPDGIVEDWYGDGNYIRTALMYVFWKTQGAYLEPWNRRVHLGASSEEGGALSLSVSADSSWRGRLCFDYPRHRDHFQIRKNYPRLNEFPEWFTVEHDQVYEVQFDGNAPRRYLGADLVSGIAMSLEAGEASALRIRPAR